MIQINKSAIILSQRRQQTNQTYLSPSCILPLLLQFVIIKIIMKSGKEILTLTQLSAQHKRDCEALNQKVNNHSYCTIGIVVDCSNIFRYNTGRDYTQKFKIIDYSCIDPVPVVIWLNRKEDFLFKVKVGDILFLNNYRVDVYKGCLQLKKFYGDEECYFRLFSGDMELTSYSPLDRKVGVDDAKGKLLTAINQLRKFAFEYLKDNKIAIFNIENAGQQRVGIGNGKTSSDFDLILRAVECNEAESSFRIKLTDEKVYYQINYSYSVNPGVYKVRSVASITWQQDRWILSGNDYTYFLQISPWMKSYDSQQWHKLQPPSNYVKKKRQKIRTIVRQVKNAQKPAERVTLLQLHGMEDNFQNVIVRCEVLDVCTKFQQCLKKYDSDKHIEKLYSQEKGIYIYSIHLIITDQSLKGDVMNVYIYTYDKQGLEFLPEMSPRGIYGRNILNLKDHYNNFVNRLVEESDLQEAPLDLMLQPMFNKKSLIYRIVRTELIF